MDDRCKDYDWKLNRGPRGLILTDSAILAVLMDIRDDLQTLNRVFRCPNFLEIPATLSRIEANTKKIRRKTNTTKNKP